MSRSSTLPTILALAALASPAAAQDEVTLRFAWPETMEADVTTVVRFEGGMAGGMAGPLGETTQRLTVRPHAQGLLVTMTGGPTTMQNPALAGQGMDGIMDELDDLTMALVIDPDGAFQGLANGDSVRARMTAVMEELAETTSGVPGIADMMAHTFSEEGMVEASRHQWDYQVGRWAGRTLSIGDTLRSVDAFPWPLAAEGRIATEERAWLAGSVPCTEEEAEARCVELHLEVQPDRAAMAEAMRTAMTRMLGADVPAEVAAQFGEMEMDMGIVFVLVTDPATLLPRRLTQTQTTTVTMPSMGMSQEQAMVMETRYHYQR